MSQKVNSHWGLGEEEEQGPGMRESPASSLPYPPPHPPLPLLLAAVACEGTLILFFFFWLRRVFIAARGLFSSCSERGLLFVSVRGLIVVASLVAEHRAPGAPTSVVVARGLSSCGSRALEHRLSSCGARA